MRDPAERLGAGLPGTSNDMQTLRAHPFFSSIHWDTLWTDPPPTLEAGLVKKEHPLAQGHDQNWEDVGAAWDDLVGSTSSDYDEVEWASDGEVPEYTVRSNRCFNTSGPVIPPDKAVDMGPWGESRRPVPVRQATETSVETMARRLAEPIETKQSLPDSPTSGSPSSSSEGSPDENLVPNVGSVNTFSLEQSSPEQPSRSSPNDQERGRDQAKSPVQGHGKPDD